VKPVYISDPTLVIEYKRKLHEARVKTLKDRHPEWSDEMIEETIKGMPEL
jgi:hypothetical protein